MPQVLVDSRVEIFYMLPAIILIITFSDVTIFSSHKITVRSDNFSIFTSIIITNLQGNKIHYRCSLLVNFKIKSCVGYDYGNEPVYNDQTK